MHKAVTEDLATTMNQVLERPTNPKPNDVVSDPIVKIRTQAQSVYVPQDSGERITFTSGSVRDTTTGKINYARVADGPMLKRWAEHLTNNEKKYPDVAPGVPNWTLIETDDELARYRASAFRHFVQWFNGETEEDHASSIFFNVNGVEHIKAKRAK